MELNEQIRIALDERGLLVDKDAGYSQWKEVNIVSEEFAGALEEVIRNCLTL